MLLEARERIPVLVFPIVTAQGGRSQRGGGGGGSSVAKSCPTLAPPWTVARQALLSIGFSRQEYCSGLPGDIPSGDLPDPGIETASTALQVPALQGDSLLLSHPSPLTDEATGGEG